MDGTVRRLTTDNDYGYTGARFSPDGRWILTTRQLSTDAVIRRKLNYGGATDLVVIPADGGPERNLTADWDYLADVAGVESRRALRLFHRRGRRRESPLPRVA